MCVRFHCVILISLCQKRLQRMANVRSGEVLRKNFFFSTGQVFDDVLWRREGERNGRQYRFVRVFEVCCVLVSSLPDLSVSFSVSPPPSLGLFIFLYIVRDFYFLFPLFFYFFFFFLCDWQLLYLSCILLGYYFVGKRSYYFN